MIKYFRAKFFCFFFIVFFARPSVGADNICSSLFENQPQSEILKVFESIIDNDIIIQKIDDVRKRYDDKTDGEKAGASIILTSLLRELDQLPYEKASTESERQILLLSVGNIMQDLVHISPRHINTRRILIENFAITYAHIIREQGKVTPIEVSGNVLSLNPQKVINNANYIAARKNVFELVDTYRIHTHLNPELITERIEELLLADVRFASLPGNERSVLASRVLKELMNPGDNGAEVFLDRYFSSREKARI